MRAMILAAGKGTRLRPLTESVPKPLVDVAGRPMIAFALQLLRQAGIQDIIINLHHLGHQIRAALGDGTRYGVQISYSEENPILDTGGAIEAARAFLQEDTFVVANADLVTDLQLRDVIAFHRSRGALATLVLRPDPQAERRDDIGIDDTQRIRRFLSRAYGGPLPGTSERYMFASVHVFEPRVFDYMRPGVYSITRDVYPRLLAAGEPILGYVHHGYWRVLDTPHDLRAGREELANWRDGSPEQLY
ncbi:MAG: putative Nucleotidyl transferase [Deltaproteobacteria bacterium]|jgi:NDP-sugar pyrophosphorylase family protein|nr:putative Nucleotidyl transferase [Deltaproteobacteria bacterium]